MNALRCPTCRRPVYLAGTEPHRWYCCTRHGPVKPVMSDMPDGHDIRGPWILFGAILAVLLLCAVYLLMQVIGALTT